MRHGATFAQALAGAACTVLLASCATQGTASPAVQDEPAGQTQVVDRAEEAAEKDEEPETEKNEGPEAEPEAEPETAEDAFDASAPVADATSGLGVDVTAPEGFLDTPEFSAVEQEIVALENTGYSVSVRMVDLETGRDLVDVKGERDGRGISRSVPRYHHVFGAIFHVNDIYAFALGNDFRRRSVLYVNAVDVFGIVPRNTRVAYIGNAYSDRDSFRGPFRALILRQVGFHDRNGSG